MGARSHHDQRQGWYTFANCFSSRNAKHAERRLEPLQPNTEWTSKAGGSLLNFACKFPFSSHWKNINCVFFFPLKQWIHCKGTALASPFCPRLTDRTFCQVPYGSTAPHPQHPQWWAGCGPVSPILANSHSVHISRYRSQGPFMRRILTILDPETQASKVQRRQSHRQDLD